MKEMFYSLQERESAILEAAHLAGHQNHHQKIHYMEKLKQQNIELSEVCTKTDILTVTKQEVDCNIVSRKLHEKIKYFEKLKEQSENDMCTQTDSRRPSKRCSFASSDTNMERSKQQERNEMCTHLESRRSSDVISAISTRNKEDGVDDRMFIHSGIVSMGAGGGKRMVDFGEQVNVPTMHRYDITKLEERALSRQETVKCWAFSGLCGLSKSNVLSPPMVENEVSASYHKIKTPAQTMVHKNTSSGTQNTSDGGVDIGMTTALTSPSDPIIPAWNTVRRLAPPAYSGRGGAPESPLSSMSLKKMTPVLDVSLDKEITKPTGIANMHIPKTTRKVTRQVLVQKNNTELYDDSAENTSPFLLVHDKTSAIAVDQKKAFFEDIVVIDTLCSSVEELKQLEPAVNDVEEENGESMYSATARFARET